jgi:heme exporter protein C
MESSSRRPAGSSHSKRRRAGELDSYGKGLPALSIATVVVITITLALVFFYAPLEAEQGFLQKIFYVHVPLAIIALCGFVLGGVFGALHLRTRGGR